MAVPQELSPNFEKFGISQSDAGRTLIVSATKTNMDHDDLLKVQAQLTLTGGLGDGLQTTGTDAFTIAGVGTADGSPFVSGTTGVVFLRLQGTGTANLTTVDDVVLAVVATFVPAL